MQDSEDLDRRVPVDDHVLIKRVKQHAMSCQVRASMALAGSSGDSCKCSQDLILDAIRDVQAGLLKQVTPDLLSVIRKRSFLSPSPAVAFLLRRNHRSSPLPALDLSRHPEAQALDVRPHDLETYDERAHARDDDPEQ